MAILPCRAWAVQAVLVIGLCAVPGRAAILGVSLDMHARAVGVTVVDEPADLHVDNPSGTFTHTAKAIWEGLVFPPHQDSFNRIGMDIRLSADVSTEAIALDVFGDLLVGLESAGDGQAAITVVFDVVDTLRLRVRVDSLQHLNMGGTVSLEGPGVSWLSRVASPFDPWLVDRVFGVRDGRYTLAYSGVFLSSVSVGITNTATFSVTALPVPEPGTVWLLAVVAALPGVVDRRARTGYRFFRP